MDDRWSSRLLLTVPEDFHVLQSSGPVPIDMSPDARRAAVFAAVRPYDGPMALVRTGVPGAPQAGRFECPSWSADSSRFACVLYEEKGGVRALVDDVPGPVFDEILSHVCFSPDAASTSYAARSGDRYLVLVDHVPVHEEPYRAGYDAMEDAPGPRWGIRRGPRSESLSIAAHSRLRALQDGQTLQTPAGPARLESLDGERRRLRVGPRMIENISHLSAFAWTNSGTWAAWVRRGDRDFLALNGRESPQTSPPLWPAEIFSTADESALLYPYRTSKGEVFVQAGARAEGPFQWVGEIECSPDGRLAAFPALSGHEVRWVVTPIGG